MRSLKCWAICLLLTPLASIAAAQSYYPIADVIVDTENDLFPVSNLIQGPGIGFQEEEPNDQIVAGGAEILWVTDAPAGFPADYIEQVGQPIIQLDLGQDVPLKEISVWGYSSTNSNGTSQFSLRFATEDEGTTAGLSGPIDYGASISYNPTFNLRVDSRPQQYNLFDEFVTARYVEFTNLDNFFIAGNADFLPDDVPPRLYPMLPGGDRVGLGEIGFLELPESFQPGDKLTRQVAGDAIGTLLLETVTVNQTIGELGPQSGLAQRWYQGQVTDPEIFNFELVDPDGSDTNPLLNPNGLPIATEGTWWSGPAEFFENGRKVPSYPRELVGTRFEIASSANSYSVKLTGEVFIEESGEVVVRDGIEDFAMIAMDLDGNGELDLLEDLFSADVNTGGELEDVLTLDTTGAPRSGGNNEVFATFENVAAGGEWREIEVWVSEGGANDGAAIYMGRADDPDIWIDPTIPLTQEQIDKFYLGNDRLRTESAVTVTFADAIASLPDRSSHEYLIQVGTTANDTIALNDASIGEGKSQLDLADTTVRIVVTEDLAPGTEFTIFGADEVIGLDTFELLLDDPAAWDLSMLAQGKIIFGTTASCFPQNELLGDVDGDGTVAFQDFVTLSSNFGTDVSDFEGNGYALGDINCSGDVGFQDFVTLSSNFGQSLDGTMSAVPEPSGLTLIPLLAIHFLIRSRRR